MKILLNKNTTEVFSPKKLLPNALASSCISSNKPHKRGIIFFSMTLLLFMLAANGVLKADCPDLLPWQNPNKPWQPFTFSALIYPHQSYYYTWEHPNGCKFKFELCYRERDIQPNPNILPLLYEYYISKITILNPDDCEWDNLDLVYNYQEIIDGYIIRFGEYLRTTANLVVTHCGAGDANPFYNVIVMGYPSCVTEPYNVERVGECGSGLPYFYTERVITSCATYSPDAICYSVYEYCWRSDYGNFVVIKKQDGSSGFHCPSEIRVKIPLYGEYETKTCHKVCGNNQPATPTSVVETVIISSVSPNPTTNGTTLTLEVLTAGSLNIKLVNVEGQELMELHNAHTEAGEFTKNFTMSNLPQGVYYLRISHNGNVKMEKVIRN